MTALYRVFPPPPPPPSFCMQLMLVIWHLCEDDWVMGNVWVLRGLISIPLTPVAGDFTLHTLPSLLVSYSLSLSLSFSFSLSLCLVVSGNLLGEMYCFRQYTRLCIILSISFLLSLPPFLLLWDCHSLYFMGTTDTRRTDEPLMMNRVDFHPFGHDSGQCLNTDPDTTKSDEAKDKGSNNQWFEGYIHTNVIFFFLPGDLLNWYWYLI